MSPTSMRHEIRGTDFIPHTTSVQEGIACELELAYKSSTSCTDSSSITCIIESIIPPLTSKSSESRRAIVSRSSGVAFSASPA